MIDFKTYSLPLETPYRWSKGTHTLREGIIVKIEMEGHIGWGEAVLPPDKLLESTTQIEQALTLINGLNILNEDFLEYLDERELPSFLRCGISTAWLCARASKEGKSLAEYLASGFSVPAKTVLVNGFVTEPTVEGAVARTREEIEKGFTTIKIKCTNQHEQDNKRIAAIREEFPHIQIRLDPNESWGVDALERLSFMEKFNVEYVEQPLPVEDVLLNPNNSAELRRKSPIPIALDQSVSGFKEVEEILEKELADILILKAPAIGGLDRCVNIIRIAEEHGINCVLTSGLETVVGRMASLHCAALLKPPIPACGFSLGRFFEYDLAEFPIDKNGQIQLPTEAGLGIDISEWWNSGV
jgi:o-succinylbenzoate synthase